MVSMRMMWCNVFVAWLCISTTVMAEVREAVKKLLPATVAIELKSTSETSAVLDYSALATDSDTGGVKLDTPPRPNSVAYYSGTVVSKDGLIATAQLSADSRDESEITVIFVDGRKLPARVVVTDQRCGLQLLKVDASDLAPVEISDNQLELGDEVLAVMCSDVNDRRVGRGIVEARNQSIANFMDLVETDVNAGVMSAGSSLSDLHGRLVGLLVAAKASPNIYQDLGTLARSGARGPSFAVPVHYVRDMLAGYRQDQHVVLRRGLFGARLKETGSARGAVVEGLIEGSAAQNAGVQKGDVVVAVNGQTVADASDFVREIGRLQPGQTARVTVVRDGSERHIDVALASLPERQPVANAPSPEIQVQQPPVAYTTKGQRLALPAETRPYPNIPDQTARPTRTDNPATVYPAPQWTVRVERSDVEQKLDSLTQAVKSLHEDVNKLREELKNLDKAERK